MDDGINISPESLEEFDDYHIYELSKHTTIENLAYKFNTTKEEIMIVIERYLELQQKVMAKLGTSDPNSFDPVKKILG
jgi:hypothetical protein